MEDHNFQWEIISDFVFKIIQSELCKSKMELTHEKFRAMIFTI